MLYDALCVQLLLSTGADVDAEDENGDTPFVHAVRARHRDVMEALRDAGCQTEIAKMSPELASRDRDFIKFCYKSVCFSVVISVLTVSAVSKPFD